MEKIELDKLNINELKVLVYDNSVLINELQRNTELINQEINKRKEQKVEEI